MGVGVEDLLADELRIHGVATRAASSQRWLTARGHLNPLVLGHAPGAVIDALDELHTALGGDHHRLASLPDAALPPSLCLENDQLVAVDDIEHFTCERLATFGHYPTSTPIGFNVESYRQLIGAWHRHTEGTMELCHLHDFVGPGRSRARRAYEDALRDLLTPVFTGAPLLRVVWPGHDPALTAAELTRRVAVVA
jgi:hypothetical protein